MTDFEKEVLYKIDNIEARLNKLWEQTSAEAAYYRQSDIISRSNLSLVKVDSKYYYINNETARIANLKEEYPATSDPDWV